MIKFGDIEYFGLLELQRILNFRDYDKLDLLTLDKLRMEVHIKIEQIHIENNIKSKKD